MPHKPLHPCSYPGCRELTPIGQPRCAEHAITRIRPNSSARGYNYRWQKKRAAFLEYNPICELCGGISDTVHHIIPKSMGGSDDDDNLQALCKRCHDELEIAIRQAAGGNS